ncbi:MAG: hypothetical protein Q8L64_00355 [bacterium]|nr:hypothetical protein [bacterium]
MSRKNNSAQSKKTIEAQKPTEGAKPTDRASINIAVIGLISAIIVAVISAVTSIINTRTQVLLPVSLTEISLPTNTNLPASASTAFVCGNGTTAPQIAFTPQPIIPEPTLVVVMVDETTTQEALEVVMSSLNESLQAGDRVIIIVGGEEEYDKATLADEKIQSIVPLIPTLLPPPPSSPTPVLVETPLPMLAGQMATRTAEAKFALATQTAIQYSCSAYEWSLSYQNQYLQWETESKRLVSATIVKLGNLIRSYETFPSANGDVFESMGLISNISRLECAYGDYEKCVFVPITDMIDARMQQPPSDIQLEYLNGFDVVGTITDCPLYNCPFAENFGEIANFLIT